MQELLDGEGHSDPTATVIMDYHNNQNLVVYLMYVGAELNDFAKEM